MGKKKNDTYINILKNAKQEFLQKGFEKASMRSIAAMTNITAGALYKHFPSKEAIFDALVQPILEQGIKSNTNFTELAIRQFQTNDMVASKEAIREAVQTFLTFMYGHFDEYRLLFNRSAGTKHEDIRHDFVSMQVAETKEFIEDLKRHGILLRLLKDDLLHIIYSAALTPLFEIITHEYPYEKTLEFMDILTDIMYSCWNKIVEPIGISEAEAPLSACSTQEKSL